MDFPLLEDYSFYLLDSLDSQDLPQLKKNAYIDYNDYLVYNNYSFKQYKRLSHI